VSAFDDAFEALLGNEGGYANHPSDPGGETMWGASVIKIKLFFPYFLAKAIDAGQGY